MLIERIAKELESKPHCAVYEDELRRVWPEHDGKPDEPHMRKFAADHGLNLVFYKDGLCAIFVKAGLYGG